MISKRKILEILDGYDHRKLTVSTIGSHSALQIFHGAKLEGLRSLNICTDDRRAVYEAFPLSKAEKFLTIENFKDVLRPEIQADLSKKMPLSFLMGASLSM